MASIMEGGFLSGKKTFIVSAVGAIGAVAAYLTGEMGLMEALPLLLGALGLGTIRDAISKLTKK